MIWLVLGVVLWSGVHFVPCAGIGARARLIDRLGEPAYKGVFALALVVAIVLMVVGWRSTAPVAVYTTWAWGVAVADLLMFVALVLLAASAVPTNLKRSVRHPQLTGVGLWAGSHLLANGDLRGLVLFGGLGLWAIVAILFINRRDGAWEKPEPQPLAGEWKPLAAAIVGFAVLYLLHPYIAGVSATPHF